MQRRSKVRWVAALAITAASARALLGCGARTPLFVLGATDASHEPDAVGMFKPDTSVVPPFDAGFDSTFDATFDVIDDLPPIDVRPADVVVVGCVDAGATQIYLMTVGGELLSFFPPTLAVTDLGAINCPSPGGFQPNSMAVDRQGTAYVNFIASAGPGGSQGLLFQVSTASVACVSTTFVADPGFTQFGMGFVGNASDGGDTLHVGADNGMTASTLGTIDTNTFAFSIVGGFGPNPIPSPELTGTGDGRLFVFYTNPADNTSGLITQVDPDTAQEIATNLVPGTPTGSDYAFAFWGGDFYIFTSQDQQTTQITEFDPAAGTASIVANTLPGQVVVGAGVSTCAPMQ